MLPNQIVAASYLDEMEKLSAAVPRAITDNVPHAVRWAHRTPLSLSVPGRFIRNILWRFASPREVYREAVKTPWMAGLRQQDAPRLKAAVAAVEAGAPHLAAGVLGYDVYRRRRRKNRRK